jgi:riboflavin kinase
MNDSAYGYAELLINIAKKGGAEKSIELSSRELGKELRISQQSASRKLKEAEEKGYIHRELTMKGQRVRLSKKGIEALKQFYSELAGIFKKTSHLVICGEVVSGLKEGSYYMKIPEYKKQFREKLGFSPYPGTLNLKLKNEEDIKARQELEKFSGISIEGFVKEGRTFGSVKCFRAKLENFSGAVIIPARTHHGFNTLEFISKEKIRDKIGLKDGDEVCVEITV